MKKFIFSILLSLIIGFFITSIHIETSVLETIYSVTGIMFSVGMSVIVTMSTQDVRNLDAKAIVHKQNNKLMRNYIIFFAIQTICFILVMLLKKGNQSYIDNITYQKEELVISFNCSISFLIFCLFCIAYYIWNMVATRDQIYNIEKVVEEERNNDK